MRAGRPLLLFSRVPAISWEQIENAIHAWVVAGSGLAEDHVIWTGQSGVLPDSEFIEMSIIELRGVGHDWKVKDDAPDAVDGAEVRVRARGMRVAQLQLQCFGDAGTGNAPLQTLGDVVSALELHYESLNTAGAGIGDVTPVRPISAGKTGLFEPRFICTVALHLGSELEARATYIQRMRLTVNAQDQAGNDIDSRTDWVPNSEAFSDGYSAGYEGP